MSFPHCYAGLCFHRINLYSYLGLFMLPFIYSGWDPNRWLVIFDLTYIWHAYFWICMYLKSPSLNLNPLFLRWGPENLSGLSEVIQVSSGDSLESETRVSWLSVCYTYGLMSYSHTYSLTRSEMSQSPQVWLVMVTRWGISTDGWWEEKLFGENEYSIVMKVPYSSCYFVTEGKGLTMSLFSMVCV